MEFVWECKSFLSTHSKLTRQVRGWNFEGRTDRLSSRSFHIGWNSVKFTDERFQKYDNNHFYFNHGYRIYPKFDDIVVGFSYASHYELLPSVVTRGQIFGFQFHPEKSQLVGKSLLTDTIFEF